MRVTDDRSISDEPDCDEEREPNVAVLSVPPESAGWRLDRFLGQALPEHSRSFFKRLIDADLVLIDGRPAKPGQVLRSGQAVRIEIPQPEPIEPQPEPIPLHVLYEDSDLLVLNKPPGMVVHPAAGHAAGTLVNALLHHCRDLSGIGGKLRPGIVHRLDKGTSGLMLVAKNDLAHNALAAQFKARTISKRYLALCWAADLKPSGRIELPIGRHPQDRQRMAALEPGAGRPALTEYRLLERLGQAGLVELRIHTGRTHQIRVHLAALGCPVLGDELYGGARKTAHLRDAAVAQAVRRAGRPLLHSHSLSFRHPRDGRELSFSVEPPPDMQAVLDLLRQGA